MISLRRLAARWLTNSRFKKLSKEQQDGLLGILVAAILSDGEVDDRELEELKTVISMMGWEGDPHQLLRGEDAQVLTGVERLEALGEALEVDWLREEAYYISARIITSDREVEDAEQEFLKHLVTSMRIEPERLHTITQKLLRETDF